MKMKTRRSPRPARSAVIRWKPALTDTAIPGRPTISPAARPRHCHRRGDGMSLRALFSTLGLAAAVFAAPALCAGPDDPHASGVTAALRKQTGVYHKSLTGTTPDFFVDPTWPAPLPHSWLLGQIGGLTVDRHDHIWVYNRPRTMTNDEA